MGMHAGAGRRKGGGRKEGEKEEKKGTGRRTPPASSSSSFIFTCHACLLFAGPSVPHSARSTPLMHALPSHASLLPHMICPHAYLFPSTLRPETPHLLPLAAMLAQAGRGIIVGGGEKRRATGIFFDARGLGDRRGREGRTGDRQTDTSPARLTPALPLSHLFGLPLEEREGRRRADLFRGCLTGEDTSKTNKPPHHPLTTPCCLLHATLPSSLPLCPAILAHGQGMFS